MSKQNLIVEIILVLVLFSIVIAGGLLSWYMTSLPNPAKGKISAVSEKL
jgi:NhaP-type Na+/H+ or K+/H+ antiporter